MRTRYTSRGAGPVASTRRVSRNAFTLGEPFDFAQGRPPVVRKGKRGAFTLIELLVVIAIIAVLAALLVPAMKRSLSMARRVSCVANMHQFGVAIHGYASTARGMMPPIWQRGFTGTPRRDLAGGGRGFTMFGVLRQTELLPSHLFRCPEDRRDYQVKEEAFYMPFYQRGEDYAGPHDHRYSYGAVNVGYLRADRRTPWSVPDSSVLGGPPPHASQIGTDAIPNPTILHLVWDGNIPLFNWNGGLPQMLSYSPEDWLYGFRHALNDLEDWSQGPCSLLADGHAESWVNWDKIVAEYPESEDYFSISLE